MIGFAESLSVWLAATAIPAFLGLAIIIWAGTRIKPVYTAAFGFGIFLWFFVDTVEGAAKLAVSNGFDLDGIGTQLAIVGLFIVGLLLFFWADTDRSIFNAESAVGKYGIAIPILVAAAVGIHGLGEGSAFGTLAATISSTSVLDAIGNVNAGIAYVLHKALEPMVVGACYAVYSVGRGTNIRGRVRDFFSLTTVFIIPSLLGAATGYFVAFDATYFFAIGTGTSIYAAIRLAAPLFSLAQNQNPRDSTRLVIALLLGFLAIYVAALFHA